MSYYHYGVERPERTVRGKHLGQVQMTVNYDIEAIEPTDEQPWKWRWKSVVLEPGVWNYDAIVSAIINAEYPADRMQAVVNNYLASPDDHDIRAEFDEMQALRAHAKEIAHRALEESEEV